LFLLLAVGSDDYYSFPVLSTMLTTERQDALARVFCLSDPCKL
jgi:hypothetical protein